MRPLMVCRRKSLFTFNTCQLLSSGSRPALRVVQRDVRREGQFPPESIWIAIAKRYLRWKIHKMTHGNSRMPIRPVKRISMRCRDLGSTPISCVRVSCLTFTKSTSNIIATMSWRSSWAAIVADERKVTFCPTRGSWTAAIAFCR